MSPRIFFCTLYFLISVVSQELSDTPRYKLRIHLAGLINYSRKQIYPPIAKHFVSYNHELDKHQKRVMEIIVNTRSFSENEQFVDDGKAITGDITFEMLNTNFTEKIKIVEAPNGVYPVLWQITDSIDTEARDKYAPGCKYALYLCMISKHL